MQWSMTQLMCLTVLPGSWASNPEPDEMVWLKAFSYEIK
jgi:hypothetical protein